MKFLNDYFLSLTEHQMGGPLCYQQVPLGVRMLTLLLSVPLHLFLVWKLKSSWQDGLVLPSQVNLRGMDKLLGGVGLLVFFLQLLSKLKGDRGVQMLNPCHAMILMSSILLCCRWSRRAAFLHGVFKSSCIGIIFAELAGFTEGLDGYETFLFWAEHIIAFPFNYFLLQLKFGHSRPSFKQGLLQLSICLLYQRFLTVVGMITLVNLNFALCSIRFVPLAEFWGHYYLLILDVYLGVSSVLGRRVLDWLPDLNVKSKDQ